MEKKKEKNRIPKKNIYNFAVKLSKICNMAKVKGAIVIDKDRCKGCEVCVGACPSNVIRMADTVNIKGYFYAEPYQDACIGCMNCAIVCPDGVITVYSKKVE